MMIMGTMHQYLNNMKLQMKWNMKKSGLDPNSSGLFDSIKEAEDEIKQRSLTSIGSKMKAGIRLSYEEMEYLRVNAPDLYQKAVKIEAEREEYQRKLRKCKTKDDVQEVQMEKLQQFASEAKAVSQSNMSRGQKIAAYEEIGMRQAAIINEHAAFVKTAKYARMKWRYEIEEENQRIMELTGKRTDGMENKKPDEIKPPDQEQEIPEEPVPEADPPAPPADDSAARPEPAEIEGERTRRRRSYSAKA